jgi:uncharacterized membrane protein
MKNFARRLAGYFFRGLLLLFPTAITIYLLVNSVRWVDSFINLGYPGLGFLTVIVGVTIVGFIFTGLLGRIVFGLLDELMSRTPLVKIIYTSLKDLIEAFVGEKKKFSEPVIVKLTESVELFGFVTRQDLPIAGMEGKVAVYLPYSYAISGHLVVVPAENIRPAPAPASNVMRFVVSAGVTGLHEEEKE